MRTHNGEQPPSPALNEATVAFKIFAGQHLGQIVGLLELGVDFEDFEFSFVRPKPMPLDKKITGSLGDPVIRRKKVSALIVFESSGVDRGVEGGRHGEH